MGVIRFDIVHGSPLDVVGRIEIGFADGQIDNAAELLEFLIEGQNGIGLSVVEQVIGASIERCFELGHEVSFFLNFG